MVAESRLPFSLFSAFQLRKECPLAQLMDCETDVVKQIRALDSDMQTLVYENYNKFISATGNWGKGAVSGHVLPSS